METNEKNDETKNIQEEKSTMLEDGSRARNLNGTNDTTDYSKIGMTDESRVEDEKMPAKENILEPIVEDASEKPETDRHTAKESVSELDLPNVEFPTQTQPLTIEENAQTHIEATDQPRADSASGERGFSGSATKSAEPDVRTLTVNPQSSERLPSSSDSKLQLLEVPKSETPKKVMKPQEDTVEEISPTQKTMILPLQETDPEVPFLFQLDHLNRSLNPKPSKKSQGSGKVYSSELFLQQQRLQQQRELEQQQRLILESQHGRKSGTKDTRGAGKSIGKKKTGKDSQQTISKHSFLYGMDTTDLQPPVDGKVYVGKSLPHDPFTIPSKSKQHEEVTLRLAQKTLKDSLDSRQKHLRLGNHPAVQRNSLINKTQALLETMDSEKRRITPSYRLLNLLQNLSVTIVSPHCYVLYQIQYSPDAHKKRGLPYTKNSWQQVHGRLLHQNLTLRKYLKPHEDAALVNLVWTDKHTSGLPEQFQPTTIHTAEPLPGMVDYKDVEYLKASLGESRLDTIKEDVRSLRYYKNLFWKDSSVATLTAVGQQFRVANVVAEQLLLTNHLVGLESFCCPQARHRAFSKLLAEGKLNPEVVHVPYSFGLSKNQTLQLPRKQVVGSSKWLLKKHPVNQTPHLFESFKDLQTAAKDTFSAKIELQAEEPEELKPQDGEEVQDKPQPQSDQPVSAHNSDAYIQEYLASPFLFDGKKFEMRLFILVVRYFGCVSVYIYDDGFVRVCPEQYQQTVVKEEAPQTAAKDPYATKKPVEEVQEVVEDEPEPKFRHFCDRDTLASCISVD